MRKVIVYAILALLLASCKGASSDPARAWVVSTIAGSSSGRRDGIGTNALFKSPSSVAVDGDGNIYVADPDNYIIRRITPAGRVSTFVGNYTQEGMADSTPLKSHFRSPRGVAVDSSGNVYVADEENHRIRKITKSTAEDGTETWSVDTFAGTTTPNVDEAHPEGQGGHVDGYVEKKDKDDPGPAQFKKPYGVAVDSSGSVFVADFGNHSIRMITKKTVEGADRWKVTTIARNLSYPTDVAVDSSGNVYVAEYGRTQIRKLTKPAGSVTTWGSDSLGARFNNPRGVAVDSSDNIYVADTDNNRIKKITKRTVAGTDTWEVTTIAGSGVRGHQDGPVAEAQFNQPYGIAVDSSGSVYVADFINNRIRKIEYK